MTECASAVGVNFCELSPATVHFSKLSKCERGLQKQNNNNDFSPLSKAAYENVTMYSVYVFICHSLFVQMCVLHQFSSTN